MQCFSVTMVLTFAEGAEHITSRTCQCPRQAAISMGVIPLGEAALKSASAPRSSWAILTLSLHGKKKEKEDSNRAHMGSVVTSVCPVQVVYVPACAIV